ncbi:hypothetical protein CPB83DRAFT_626976 [Crepidotus variabilis]|uniref:Yeast cell wall synthesis Kre9/Knh1-like N-terminal domain-containing protein n=1 Tax=Crepidotus variabilis TaxID=179855 RepID=A0A9P6EPH9_9AGAR|nr:hypothetical protein CPB83DRAFT_626976 [Crepidotus variabilis]
MKLSIFATLATVFVAGVNASAVIQRAAQDVYSPHITSPTAGVVWTSGQTQTVTWDTSDAPAHITNRIGRIVLRKGATTTPLVLADNFDILDGKAQVTVPNVVAGSDYEVVLFGDSGNISPEFTITGSGLAAATD